MMRMYKYDYTVIQENSPEIFKATCSRIEHSFPALKKEELLVDVDGSAIQVYNNGETRIVIYDDYEIGAVFVKSDIDLSKVI
jgi:hypothetical protein